MYKEGIISFFYLIEMGYFEPLSGFEEHFISGISPNANLDFLDASIVYLREAVFSAWSLDQLWKDFNKALVILL